MNIEKQIEFDKIKELWKELALTQWAKEKIENSTFFLSETELRGALRDTTNARDLMERLGTPPLQNVSEVREILLIAQKGDCLMPCQLERVEKALVAATELFPEDYDFSILFETVENRKKQHDMSRKYTTDVIRYEE